jgi:pyruvate kinase
MDLMDLGLLGAVARFDFSWGNPEYHQGTLENLKAAVKTTKKLCAVRFFFFFFFFYICKKHIYYAYCNSNVETFCVVQVMLDTVGPELQVVNKSGNPISLLADGFVILTPDQEQEASSKVLPINFDGLSKVCFIFVFTFSFLAMILLE